MTPISARARVAMLAGLAAALTSACGGGGAASSVPPPAPPPSPPSPPLPPPPPLTPLRQRYAGDFLVGAAVQANQLTGGPETDLIKAQFDTIVAEYQMKADQIAPTETAYDWTAADAIVNFGTSNGIRVRGHALVWHQTTPSWMLAGGNPTTIRTRLERYVTDVVSRYRGRVFAWDVVNEPASDSGPGDYRTSNWFNAVGPDYIEWALRAARAADPNCKLYINDYSTESPSKRARLMAIVDALRAKGAPLDGVGHQFHLQRSQSITEINNALDTVAARGLVNHITELDISVYDDPGSCFATPPTGCSAELTAGAVLNASLSDQARLYRQIFQSASARASVDAVLVWGLQDSKSWLNAFPIRRANYPLLFDKDLAPKSAFYAVADPGYVIP